MPEQNQNSQSQQVEEEVISSTAVEVNLDPPVAPQGPVTYIEEEPIIPDMNRRYVDALNSAGRASALGQDPVPFYMDIQTNPLYDAQDRSKSILESVGAIADQVTPQMEKAVAKGEDTSWIASKFKKAMGFVFPSGDPAKELYEATSSLSSLGLPIEAARATLLAFQDKEDKIDVPEVSKAAMLEARAYVESVPTTSQMTDAEKEDAAFVKYMEFMTAKVADEVGFNWGTAGDVAGFLAPQETVHLKVL